MRRTRARLPGTLACTLLLLGSGCSGTREASATADADQQLSAAERPAVGRGIMLPTGVRLDPTGRSIPVGNMPLSALPAPDNRHLFLLLSGWREEGLQVVDVAAGRVTQTLKQAGAFVGLAMTRDGRSLYTSGGGADMVYRYDWRDGRATLADSIDLSATGERRGARHIAGIALSPDGTRLYAVENLSDSLAVIDLSARRIVQRVATGRAPYEVVTGSDANVYVSLWGDSVVQLFAPQRDNAARLRRVSAIAAGRHPSAMLLNRSGTRLFVAAASTQRITVIDTRSRRALMTLRDTVPAPVLEGSTPDGLALSSDERTLYVAEADNNAVAVFGLSDASSGISAPARSASSSNADRLLGRMPTEWYPTAIVTHGGRGGASSADSLLVINGKGRGTGPNPGGLRPDQKLVNGDRSYTLGQLDGTITVMPTRIDSSALAALDRRVATANNWLSGGREATSRALHSVMPPIKHVILIIKENRTFDQVLADLPGVDGDTALQFFTRSASPNHHALAERFGAFDHFFTNAEVSSQGHQWSTAAYVTDYIEKTTPAAYSGRRAEPDEAGEVDEPVAGYLWTLALKKGLWFRNYGEYGNPEPDSSHGAVRYHSFLRSLEQSTDQSYPPFDLAILDQRRVDEWLREFTAFQKSDSMPALETMHLPNDHTAGARAGMHTPRAMFADNDLAVGRIVEAVSRSKFWSSTAIFVLEDDAQAGPDHVDSHRSVLLVASPYARSGAIHRFVNTTDVLATIEELLHLPALSRFDEFAHPLREIWRASADLRPYVALTPSQSLDERNPKRSAMSGASETLDLRNADRIDDAKFNRILWRTIKGTTAYPGVRRVSMLELVRAW